MKNLFSHAVNRLSYLFLRKLSYCLRPLRHGIYTKVLVKAFSQLGGVKFNGIPKYIHHDVYLDEIGGIELGRGIVISTRAILLTHDFSYNVGCLAIGKSLQNGGDFLRKSSITVGDYSFIGAGAIVLPGSTIGKYCVIGSGCIVKGDIPDYSIVIGNPAKVIGDTRSWGEKNYNKYIKEHEQ